MAERLYQNSPKKQSEPERKSATHLCIAPQKSVKLLSEMASEVMVAFQCGNIGSVGFVQPGGRCVVPGFAVGEKTLPDGKKFGKRLNWKWIKPRVKKP